MGILEKLTVFLAGLTLLLANSCSEDREPAPGGPSVCTARISQTINTDDRLDVLLVIDNSPSMAAKLQNLQGHLRFLRDQLECIRPRSLRVAVITTGFASDACAPCDETPTSACLNESGESGVFQDRVGSLQWEDGVSFFTFERDEACRVADGEQLDCIIDELAERGTALVGVNGCPYRRPLAAMRRALDGELLAGPNAGFLRDGVPLYILLFSDGEDCGEPGEVAEGIEGVGEDICSYAAAGEGPAGEGSHPSDPASRPYELTPVVETYEFLMGLKGGQEGMVKFAAVVGVEDVDDLNSTQIVYEGAQADAAVLPACQVEGCQGLDCGALPGTRAIALARLFGTGKDGDVDSICRDGSSSMYTPCGYVSCPRVFNLANEILDPALVSFRFDGEEIPTYSCAADTAENPLVACAGPGDTSCGEASCERSWTYRPPDGAPEAPGGAIVFSTHVEPCEWVEAGEELLLELEYATPCD